MKKLFLVLVCAASVIAASAQVKFGLKAGANFASITDGDGLKSKIGINGGVQVALALNEMFSVAPEAVYSSQGAKAEEGDGTLNLDYINVPVLIQYNNPSGFFAHTGPQVGFLMSAKAKAGGETQDMKEFMNSTDFAWVIGAGFATQSGFGINARYNLGLSKIAKDDEAGSSKNSVIQLGLFYNFGGKAAKK
jgi:hypothetical protein